MEYCNLPGTDMAVSKVCLGTVHFGAELEEKKAIRQMDLFCSEGGNFFDTAHVYGDWLPGERARSERVIGHWIKESGKRADVYISTKGAHPLLDSMSVSRVRPEEIRKDVEESLAALQTDYIDLYFLHRDDPTVAAAELLGVLEEQRKEGKIRWYGCSNWSLQRMLEADRIAEQEEFDGFVCDQLMWSLADINLEAVTDPSLVAMSCDIWNYHKKSGKSVMAYTSMAHGYLSKRDRGAFIDQSVCLQYDNERNEKILQLLHDYGLPVSKAALAYLIYQPFKTVPIVSFSKEEQLIEAVHSCELKIPSSLMEEIMKIKVHSA